MVVVVGGFGGLQAVRRLRHAPVDITLIDRRNLHLFNPLIYQVATGALSPGEMPRRCAAFSAWQERPRPARRGHRLRSRAPARPSRPAPERRRAARDLVRQPDRRRRVELLLFRPRRVAAARARRQVARERPRGPSPDLDSVRGGRGRADPDRRPAWLTFVVVGGGPTGVELAGQIAEIARGTLRRDFRTIDTRAARILLVEMAECVLPAFPPRLSARAARALEGLGVTPLVGRKVVSIDEESATITVGEEEAKRLPARTIV